VSRIEEVLRRASRETLGELEPDLPPLPADAAEAADRAADPLAAWDFSDLSEPDAPAPIEVIASVTSAAVPWVAPQPEVERQPDVEPRPEVVEPSFAVGAEPSPVVEEPPAPTGSNILITRTVHLDAIEQYRKLAAALHEAQGERGIRSVLCTSGLMGEGKTVTACNLALTLSESYGRRVLLVDADLRRPQVHVMFGVPNTAGLREALASREETKLKLQQVSPRLSVLTAGMAEFDPMSGLTSDRLRQVIAEASVRFDWVILDTPPVLILPDARVLVSTVDAVLLVVRAGSTSFRTVKRAVEVIKRERIFGAVLNSVQGGLLASDYAGYDRYYAGIRPS